MRWAVPQRRKAAVATAGMDAAAAAVETIMGTRADPTRVLPAPSSQHRPHPIIRNQKKFLRVRVAVRPLQGLGNLLYLELGPAR